jgi:hypothetical protein
VCYLYLVRGVLAEVRQGELGVLDDLSAGGEVLLGEHLQQSGLSSSVGSHHTASGGGSDVEVDGIIEDEHVGLRLVGESHIHSVQQRDIGQRKVLGVLQRGGSREGELALQSDLLGVVLLRPLLKYEEHKTKMGRTMSAAGTTVGG